MRFLLLCCCLVIGQTLQAFSLKDSAPKYYIVKQGDTLWSIANEFLHKPWEWKALWHANPQLNNPNRLYPGDEIVLRFDKQRKYLRTLSNGTVKLSPHMRPMLRDNAIPPIPLADIEPFFNQSVIMDENRLFSAPYVVAFGGERLLGGQGDEVYVKNLCPEPESKNSMAQDYALFRSKGEYRDPVSGCLLGYKAMLVGRAELLAGGDPAKLRINSITTGVKRGDRVLPNETHLYDLFFEPKTPESCIQGQIIDMPGEFTKGAVGSVVVIDRGEENLLEAGDVLAVYSQPHSVRDPEHPGELVTIPPERIGEVMVFRTFSKASFALVMRSSRAITIKDAVKNP